MNRRWNGRFDSFKSKVKRAVKLGKIGVIGTVVVVSAFLMGKYNGTEVTYAVETAPKDTLEAKVEEFKTDLLDTLQACESAGRKESDGLIVFDSNAKASIGTFQFQIGTVKHYYKKFNAKDITNKEAILIALDDDKARELADQIIFENNEDGLRNWYNCTKKHNLQGKLDIINKLQN